MRGHKFRQELCPLSLLGVYPEGTSRHLSLHLNSGTPSPTFRVVRVV